MLQSMCIECAVVTPEHIRNCVVQRHGWEIDPKPMQLINFSSPSSNKSKSHRTAKRDIVVNFTIELFFLWPRFMLIFLHRTFQQDFRSGQRRESEKNSFYLGEMILHSRLNLKRIANSQIYSPNRNEKLGTHEGGNH